MSDAALAAQHLLKCQQATESFEHFVRLVEPDWIIPDFQLEIMDTLQAMEERKFGTYCLSLNLPPRHNKSTLCSILYPLWFLARNPKRKVMAISYSDDPVKDFAKGIRSYRNDGFFKQAFPKFELQPEATALCDWHTKERGRYFAAGIDGASSGKPANLLIIDDPFKNRKEAFSAKIRDNVWDAWENNLRTRREPEVNGAHWLVIIIMTRWHEDDLIGRLKEKGQWIKEGWKEIKYEAIREVESEPIRRCDLPPTDRDFVTREQYTMLTESQRKVTRMEEVALWPATHPLEEHKITQEDSPEVFEALYQQNPTMKGGNVIKTAFFQRYSIQPQYEEFQKLIVTADTAFKDTEGSDYSAILTAGILPNGDIYFLDMIREKLEFPDLLRRMSQVSTHLSGKGLKGIYVEEKSSGISLIQTMRRWKRDGKISAPVIPYKVDVNKLARVNSVKDLIDGMCVYIPENDLREWVEDFVKECARFRGLGQRS